MNQESIDISGHNRSNHIIGFVRGHEFLNGERAPFAMYSFEENKKAQVNTRSTWAMEIKDYESAYHSNCCNS